MLTPITSSPSPLHPVTADNRVNLSDIQICNIPPELIVFAKQVTQHGIFLAVDELPSWEDAQQNPALSDASFHETHETLGILQLDRLGERPVIALNDFTQEGIMHGWAVLADGSAYLLAGGGIVWVHSPGNPLQQILLHESAAKLKTDFAMLYSDGTQLYLAPDNSSVLYALNRNLERVPGGMLIVGSEKYLATGPAGLYVLSTEDRQLDLSLIKDGKIISRYNVTTPKTRHRASGDPENKIEFLCGTDGRLFIVDKAGRVHALEGQTMRPIITDCRYRGEVDNFMQPKNAYSDGIFALLREGLVHIYRENEKLGVIGAASPINEIYLQGETLILVVESEQIGCPSQIISARIAH